MRYNEINYDIIFIGSLVLAIIPFVITEIRKGIKLKKQKAEKTKEGYADFLNKHFLVDNYKVNDIVMMFYFDAEKQTINLSKFETTI